MRNGKENIEKSTFTTDTAQFRLQLHRRRNIPTNTSLHGHSTQRILLWRLKTTSSS